MITIRAGPKATAIAWRWLLRKGDGSQVRPGQKDLTTLWCPSHRANPMVFSHLGADMALGPILRPPSTALPKPRERMGRVVL